MKNFKPAAFALATVLLFAGAPAHAYFVQTETDGGSGDTVATGILDLDIGGTAYDVTFDFAPATSVPVACGVVPCDAFFDGVGTAAQAAVLAINAALNDLSEDGGPPTGDRADQVGTAGGPTNLRTSYFVPWDTSMGGNNVDAWEGAGGGVQWGLSGADLDFDTDVVHFARFAPAVIPIPPAAWLFGSALGLLGWIRRHGQQARPRPPVS